MALERNQLQQLMDADSGILRLAPTSVPRSFMVPGRRLKLHPDDIYAYGVHRGGINERWFSSTTKASNGPDTTEFEGLSFIVTKSGDKVLLKEAIETAGDLLMGSEAWEREKGWNVRGAPWQHTPDPHCTTPCGRASSVRVLIRPSLSSTSIPCST